MSQIVTRESDCVEGQLEGETSWQEAMKLAYRDLTELLNAVGLNKTSVEGFADERAGADFPLFVPREWARRIRHNDPHDPLLQHLAISGEIFVQTTVHINWSTYRSDTDRTSRNRYCLGRMGRG